MRPALVVVLVALAPLAHADTFTGKVVSVADGDTITVLRGKTQVKVRLYGANCPEKGQPFGKKAKQFTSRAVSGKTVEVKAVTRGGNGRIVGVVLVSRRAAWNLNHALTHAGLAWWDRKSAPKDKTLAKLEAEARKAKRGLWAHKNPVPPWEWRRGKRSVPVDKDYACEADADCELRQCCCSWFALRKGSKGPKECRMKCDCGHIPPRPPGLRCFVGKCRKVTRLVRMGVIYHGNIKSKVYHGAECKHFRCKNCTAVFYNAATAHKAGYRPHKACVAGPSARPTPPKLPWSKERVCKRDKDCVLHDRHVCDPCPSRSPAWRTPVNRKTMGRWKAHWAIIKCRVYDCAKTRWLGTKAVCAKGQCAVR